MIIDLSGKTALVCGSTGGIGRCIAEEMAASGARIILLARNEEKLKNVLAELPGANAGHDYFCADFNDNTSVSEAAQKIAEKYPIDILVNNTGGPPAGQAQHAGTEEFLTAFKNHLINNHILATSFIPSMKNKKWGRILNIISTSVKQPLPNLGVSNTIRGAVANWSKTLATELAPFGITVNNILPGATSTERLKAIIENKSKNTAKALDEVSGEMLKEIPAGRFADPSEPAYAAVFLASDKAAYITGTNVVVDGGRTGNL